MNGNVYDKYNKVNGDLKYLKMFFLSYASFNECLNKYYKT